MLWEVVSKIIVALLSSVVWVYFTNKVIIQKSKIFFFITSLLMTIIMVIFNNPVPVTNGAIGIFGGFIMIAIVIAIKNTFNKSNSLRQLLNRCQFRYKRTEEEVHDKKVSLYYDKKFIIEFQIMQEKQSKNTDLDKISSLENELDILNIDSFEADEYENEQYKGKSISDVINEEMNSEIMFTSALVVGLIVTIGTVDGLISGIL